MKTGWLKEDGSWYLLQGNGVMASSGWSSYGGYWYYFNGSGVMQTGTITDNGTTYDLGADGGIADPTSQKAQGYSSATNYLILVNLAAFILYGADKALAKRGARRIPERTLLLWAWIGGSIGAFLGMRLFRHKTKKAYFWTVNGIALIVHVVIAVWLSTKGI